MRSSFFGVWRWSNEKLILNFNRSVLCVRTWCGKEADSGTGMGNNSCLFGESQNLFDKSRVYLANHRFIWQIYVANHGFIWRITGIFLANNRFIWRIMGVFDESRGFFFANNRFIWRIMGVFDESRIYLVNHGFIWQITDLFDESRVYLVNHGFIWRIMSLFEVKWQLYSLKFRQI